MKTFTELNERALFLKSEKGITRTDKKVLLDYFNENEGMGDEFTLASEDEVTALLVEEMENESICYFNLSFLADYTTVPVEALKVIQSSYSVDAMLAIFGDAIEEIAADALALDGVGHFFNHYDSTCEEITINNEPFYFWFN